MAAVQQLKMNQNIKEQHKMPATGGVYLIRPNQPIVNRVAYSQHDSLGFCIHSTASRRQPRPCLRGSKGARQGKTQRAWPPGMAGLGDPKIDASKKTLQMTMVYILVYYGLRWFYTDYHGML